MSQQSSREMYARNGSGQILNHFYIDEGVLEQRHANEIELGQRLYELLIEHFTPDFCNSFIDFRITNLVADQDGNLFLKSHEFLSQSLGEAILEWIFQLQQHCQNLCKPTDWVRIAEIAFKSDCWGLMLVVGLIGTKRKAQVSRALENMSGFEFEEVFKRCTFIPVNKFRFAQTPRAILNCLRPEYYSDHEIFEILHWLAQNGATDFPPRLLARMSRLPEKQRYEIEIHG